ncbi:MAG TPA: nucleotidyltransferase [Candidatus Acetothermia bacterium]|nr:nucleotidyltransferase [Candidatus Acetothermia bacterium]
MGELTLVVMAAGVGSRYGGPKQLEPIGPNGETFSDYSVYDALQAGFGHVIFILNREVETAFRSQVGRRIENHCRVDYVIQRLDDLPPGFPVPSGRAKPWGTAHAVLSCKGLVDAPFAVINADDFYGRGAFVELAAFLRNVGSGSGILEIGLVGYRLENTLSPHGPVTRGVCQVDGDGYLVRIEERRGIQRRGRKIVFPKEDDAWEEVPEGTIVSMNMWGFPVEIFPELSSRFPRFLREHARDIETAEYLLPEVVGELVAEGRARVRVIPTDERWFGVTYREDLADARAAIAELVSQGVYPEKLWG